jgi:adhesin transport system outer membrane protein
MRYFISQVRLVAAIAFAALLVGCAGPSSYVVLMPSPDGTVGKVLVRGKDGQQLLTQAQTGADLDGSKAPFAVKIEDLWRDFGPALSARPAMPEQFLLYFEVGGTELTLESKALLPQILERARSRRSLDMSVIGHTDTQGAADANEALALQRATGIAQQLRQLGLADAVIAVESHGERNLLVPTPDDTPEPRNRRVEITLR